MKNKNKTDRNNNKKEKNNIGKRRRNSRDIRVIKVESERK